MPESLESLSKTLKSFLTGPRSPADLQLCLDACGRYVETNSPIESSESHKLHEDLVKSHLALQDLDSAQHAVAESQFVAVLAQLLPCLLVKDDIKYWVAYYANPALNSAGQGNEIVAASRRLLLQLLLADHYEDDDTVVYRTLSDTVAGWLLDIYSDITTDFSFTSHKNGQIEDERARFVKKNAKDLLIEFGTQRPRPLFELLNARFPYAPYRLHILSLLSVFVATQPASLADVRTTGLLDSLFSCLFFDTSSTSLAQCSRTLALVLPSICVHLANAADLCRLFAAFGRLASWDLGVLERQDLDKLDTDNTETDNTDKNDKNDKNDNTERDSWQVLVHVIVPANRDPPNVDALFTFLYGIFPSNFVDFVRAPSTYLKNAGFAAPFDDFWSDSEINHCARRLLGRHSLHPELIRNDAANELTDASRWTRLGDSPSDVAAFCLDLDLDHSYAKDSIKVKEKEIPEMDHLVEQHHDLFYRPSIQTQPQPQPQSQSQGSDSPTRSPAFLPLRSPVLAPVDSPSRITSPTQAKADWTALVDRANYYSRELMLLKNELDFVVYIEQLTRYRLQRTRQQLEKKTLTDEVTSQLFSENNRLNRLVYTLRQDLTAAQQELKHMRDHRQNVDRSMLDRIEAYRKRINELTTANEEYKLDVSKLRHELAALTETLLAREARVSELELAQVLPNSSPTNSQASPHPNGPESSQKIELAQLQADYDELVLELQTVREEKNQAVQQLQSQLDECRAQLESLASRPKSQPSEDLKRLIQNIHDQLSNPDRIPAGRYTELIRQYDDMELELSNSKTAKEVEDFRALISQSQPKTPFFQGPTLFSGSDDYQRRSTLEPEVRMRGRGGVQNAVSQPKPKPKASFRGLRM